MEMKQEREKVRFPTANVVAGGVATGLATAAAVGLSPLIPVAAFAGGLVGFVLTNKIPSK
jgi:hypothetical protein